MISQHVTDAIYFLILFLIKIGANQSQIINVNVNTNVNVNLNAKVNEVEVLEQCCIKGKVLELLGIF